MQFLRNHLWGSTNTNSKCGLQIYDYSVFGSSYKEGSDVTKCMCLSKRVNVRCFNIGTVTKGLHAINMDFVDKISTKCHYSAQIT